MRLNLGCGDDVREGYENVDFRRTHPSVVEVDLSYLPWPWRDGSADEVMMLDFIEHFPMNMTGPILAECRRVLRTGGILVIQVPDMEVLGRALARDQRTLCNSCGSSMNVYDCSGCGKSWLSVQIAAVGRIYGGQDFPGNFHQVGFTSQILLEWLSSAGFSGPQFVERDHQERNWNMKVVARRF